MSIFEEHLVIYSEVDELPGKSLSLPARENDIKGVLLYLNCIE